MLSEIKTGMGLIVLGITAIFTMMPETVVGKVVVVFMGLIFILVGSLYTWIGCKNIDSDK